MLCEHCSVADKTLGYYQCCYNYKYKIKGTIWTALKKMNSILTRHSTAGIYQTFTYKKTKCVDQAMAF